MIAWPPRQHDDGSASASGFIEDRQISQVTFHVLIPPFRCASVSVLDKQQCSTRCRDKTSRILRCAILSRVDCLPSRCTSDSKVPSFPAHHCFARDTLTLWQASTRLSFH